MTPGTLTYDVRNGPEVAQGQLEDAIHIPLAEVNKLAIAGRLTEKFPRDKSFYLYCKSGTRSVMACSILKKYGYKSIYSIDGGFDAMKNMNNMKFTPASRSFFVNNMRGGLNYLRKFIR